MLEAAFAQQKPLIPLVNELVKNTEKLANTRSLPNNSSTGNSSGRNYRDALAGSGQQGFVAKNISDKKLSTEGGHTPAPPAEKTPAAQKPVKRFRVTLSNEKDGPSIRQILDVKAAQGQLSEYDYKAYGKNSVDLLFNSLAEAEAEHVKVVKILDELNVSKPDINRSRKAYLVGLADYHMGKEEDVYNYILRRYGDELLLNDANKDCLKVASIDPCAKNPRNFRATLQLSESVLSIISKKLNNRLRVGYISCIVYPVVPHKRCHKCQEHGHFKRHCKQEVPTCAHCAGEHFTDQCTNSHDAPKKCINCFKSDDFKNDCNHSADSNLCPVFLAYRSKQKN